MVAITITDMVHDRPMNLSTWVTSDGRAYAVQRDNSLVSSLLEICCIDNNLTERGQDADGTPKLFKGYCFHIPSDLGENAVKVSINARFSLLAVGQEKSVI